MFSQIFLLTFAASCYATVERPMGVAISMASLYKPGASFMCLDGSKKIPWDHVNDDYCDCPDGTDEPGTAACPNGKFHCTNAGYKPMNILSSRVNDGICDCCDGTDEWEKRIECTNNCKELGKKMREERDKVRQLQEEGYKTKLTYIEQGKKNREDKRAELEQLEKDKAELEAVKVEMEAKKNNAEAPEREAKERHENAWKEELEKKKAEKEHLRALVVFDELDANDDKRIDMHEIKAQSQFDIDSNGEVSDEEAKEHLEDAEFAEFEHFLEKVWPHIKEFYKSPESKEDSKGDNSEQGEASESAKISDNDDDETDYDDDDEDEEHDEYRDEEQIEAEEKKEEQEEEEKMPDYDDDTKALIAAADEARNQFNSADEKLRDVENKVKSVNSYLDLDYGPEEEYSTLKGNCYEYTDREYTYKLCAFDRASQRPKHGGSETTLGNWGHWEGPENDKYATQKYENGQNCWNGPNRSVKVNLKCGTENKLTNAFEPNRCVYEFDFYTPSRCSHVQPQEEEHIHDEF